MSSNFFIKPASDKVKVRDPSTGKSLAAEGETKPMSSYWMRRVRDKDVIEATPPAGAGGEAATDTVVTGLLSGSVDQVKAGLGDLSAEALQLALTSEQAVQQRKGVITAIQAEISARAANH